MSDELEKFIEKCLNDFYESRIDTIDKINLKKILCRKNPYLFKALNTERASEIIDKIVTAYMDQVQFLQTHQNFHQKEQK